MMLARILKFQVKEDGQVQNASAAASLPHPPQAQRTLLKPWVGGDGSRDRGPVLGRQASPHQACLAVRVCVLWLILSPRGESWTKSDSDLLLAGSGETVTLGCSIHSAGGECQGQTAWI